MALDALSGDGTSRRRPHELFELGEAAKATSVGESLYVLLDALPEQPVEVLGWRARTTAVVRGDRCLVARVADNYWFVTWDIPGWS